MSIDATKMIHDQIRLPAKHGPSRDRTCDLPVMSGLLLTTELWALEHAHYSIPRLCWEEGKEPAVRFSFSTFPIILSQTGIDDLTNRLPAR